MNLRFKPARLGAAVLVASVALMGLTACGDDKSQTAAYTADDETCLTLPDDQQRQQYVDYARDNGDIVRESESFNDTVCVLERGSDGSYSQHYYNRDDHFADYAMMAFLMPHAAGPLLTLGAINGDLDFGEVMFLSMMTSFNSQGQPYRPYSYYDNGSWGRSTTVIDNRRVTNVYYGTDRTAKPKTAPRPANYGKPKPLPKATDAVGNVKIDPATGRPVVTKTADTGAKNTIGTAKPAPVKLPASKRTAPAPNVPNPVTATPAAPAPKPAPQSTQPPVGTPKPAPAPAAPSAPKPQTQDKPAPAPAPKPAPAAPKPAAPKPASPKVGK